MQVECEPNTATTVQPSAGCLSIGDAVTKVATARRRPGGPWGFLRERERMSAKFLGSVNSGRFGCRASAGRVRNRPKRRAAWRCVVKWLCHAGHQRATMSSAKHGRFDDPNDNPQGLPAPAGGRGLS